MKKIKFKTTRAKFLLKDPTPSARVVPEWFRLMPRVHEGIETVKVCMPFLDSMTMGYTICLSADTYFENGECKQIAELSFVEAHIDSQISPAITSEIYAQTPLKWINYFIAQTPKGYSSLFMHPANRLDLPFFTLSGVVDTDEFPAPVNFPFLVQKDFTGIILEGTPIAQVIPFKREEWKADVENEKDAIVPVSFLNQLHSPPFNFYKRKFWKRKNFS
jgi:hypothetical protein